MTPSEKILYILRHAKAEPALPGQEDHDRPLAEKGLEEAARIAHYFAAQHIKLDKILCSTSVRTRATWDSIKDHYECSAPVEYTEKLYLSSANQIVALLAALPDSVNNVLLLGHNPGLHEICMKMIVEGEEKTIAQLTAKFPPCALAAVRFSSPGWGGIRDGGTLVDYKIPDSL